MAQGTNLRVWMDLQNNPLGREKGENFGMAANYMVPPARIYVVNHSRTRKWKRIVVPVSARRGADEALIYDKELAKIYNVDTLTKRVEEGRDMNRYATELHPVVWALKVGGKIIPIPPARNADTPPPRVEVPEGAWDLYLGNYDRMRGVVRDMRGNVVRENDSTVIGEESTRYALAWSRRLNPVLSYTDDGVTTSRENSHGFLEFIREPIRAMSEQIDKEYLSALDLIEA